MIVPRRNSLCGWRFGLAVLWTSLILSGCARGPRESMGHFLDNGSDRKLARADSQAEPVSSVTANAPGQTAAVVDPSMNEPAPDSGERLAVDVTDGPSLAVPAVLDEEGSRLEIPPQKEKESSGPKIWDRRMVSAAAETTVNRLKKALSTDTRPEPTPLDPLSRTHPLRVKVDGLHQKAVTLLEAGELQEAKAHAERAVDLSESLALEFLPNEEHPEDLLQRITLAIDELDQAPTAATPPIADMDAVSGRILPTDDGLPIMEMPAIGTGSSSPAMLSGTVAANRPLRLPESTSFKEDNVELNGAVEIGPILGEEPLDPTAKDPFAESELPALASADRLRTRLDSGPLLLSAERRPSTSQVAEAAPLPAFRSTVASRPAPSDPVSPGSGFEWVDLWPLGVLVGLMLFFASGLLLRRLVTGH